MSLLRDFSASARSHRAPVTVGLIVAMILGFLYIWMTPRALAWGTFATHDAWNYPWTFFTYPYAASGASFIGLVFLCWWLWGIGGSVEHDLGTAKYLGVWFLFSFLCAFFLWLGAMAVGRHGILFGAWTPVAALTVIWGTRNATAQVMLMFVIPIQGKWLAWLSAGLVFFGTAPPQLAPFAALPLFLAYLFAANKLPLSYGREGRSQKGLNPAGTRKVYKQEYYDEVKRREQAREEKERLRKLFEQSVADDEPEDKA